MKILFICGALEPGKDGVGDYTKKLAENIAYKQNCNVSILAINDRFIEKGISIAKENVHSVRMSDKLSWGDRIKFLKTEVKDEYDIASLQYVPYSYQIKGLPFRLVNVIKKNLRVRNWHIMFHELWVGIPISGNLKIYLLKYMQRKLVYNTIYELTPIVISTSIDLYKKQLPFNNVSILPLFGNICINNYSFKFSRNENILNIVHFGSFSSYLSEFRSQLLWCKRLSISLKKRPIFNIAGKGGMFMDNAINLSKEIFGDNNVKFFGTLCEEEISNLFLNSDLGVSRANYEFYGKSGSTISMLEHGLPVLLRGKRSNFTRRNEKQLYFYSDKLPESLFLYERKSRLDKVTCQLYYELKENIK